VKAGADVRPRHRKRAGDLFGVQRRRRKKQERMHLGDRPIDTPARAHFAPMEDKFLGDWSEGRGVSSVCHVCHARIYSNNKHLSRGRDCLRANR
jgi:hypothetical protein